MSSNQFVLAYACQSELPMSEEELTTRIVEATKHLDKIVTAEPEAIRIGDGRTGFIVWRHGRPNLDWPSVTIRGGEGAAWLHVPAAAGSPKDGIDPVTLARDFVDGRLDRDEMGLPSALMLWDELGLEIMNDRLGMTRIFEFDMAGFGKIWSSRQGLAHVFGGLEPALEASTWHEMATIGWPIHGKTHLGSGEQLVGSTSISVKRDGTVVKTNDRDMWRDSIWEGQVPSLAESAKGMIRYSRIAEWWHRKPIADLSGGKDSRVTAAAAIRAGVVDTVRTVNTDPGEVDTARTLVALSGSNIEHRIDEVAPPKTPEGGVFERFLSLQRAWEGALNALSAYRAPTFKTFQPGASVRINGLGGEAIQGVTQVGPKSRVKLQGQGPGPGRDHLVYLATARALGVTEEARNGLEASIDRFVDAAHSAGMSTATMVVDYFYHFSKMTYWAHPQATNSTILPLYSPQLMPRTMWSLKHPTPYGEIHRQLLEEIDPSWADVPFYKSGPTSRTVARMWENPDWRETAEVVADGVSQLEAYSRPVVLQMIEAGDNGSARPVNEFAFSRIMWELSFREYAREVGAAAKITKARVDDVRSRVRS